MTGKSPLDLPPAEKQARDYRDYVSDPTLAAQYEAYQAKYGETPKECDKKTAQIILQSLRTMQSLGRAPRILDIGCSTGNFLRHLKRVVPEAELVGGDLMLSSIEGCRADPHLKGIDFEIMDVFDIPHDRPFDIITANAVNVYFEPDEYAAAMRSISRALSPGGYFIAYEWVHSDLSERKIVETSAWHPNGLKIWFRSQAFVSKALRDAGFAETHIELFEMPIDLPRPAPGSEEARTMVTFTVKTEDGRRLMFRGEGLYQPWAHIVARKALAAG